jgi:hypothetical protein
VSINTVGPRGQVAALVACAVAPDLFKALSTTDGLTSFADLRARATRYQESPELFCLDLARNFEIDTLATLAGPAKLMQH